MQGKRTYKFLLPYCYAEEDKTKEKKDKRNEGARLEKEKGRKKIWSVFLEPVPFSGPVRIAEINLGMYECMYGYDIRKTCGQKSKKNDAIDRKTSEKEERKTKQKRYSDNSLKLVNRIGSASLVRFTQKTRKENGSSKSHPKL